ncbi:diguanylate cyclase [Glacieibacterium sp.]|uniref:GGDEF domain-containing protein n=1 Tax=Glacieibacterium sp. TaxID=2860237 RepID=UPI003B00C194
MVDGKLLDEPARLAALARCGVLDTKPEAQFDKITGLVQVVLGVPIAAVSLIAADRQMFKSIRGMAAQDTSRNVAFCSHTIMSREPLIVPDAMLDLRFSENHLVIGAPGIRAYAGVPVRSPDGYNLGALCAIDTNPRTFDAGQIEILHNFASLVENELELRTIADKDFLTGAMTRRAFVEAATMNIRNAERQQRTSALIMFDIDHFKKVNDRFGHPVGDQVLQIVGGCVDRLLPPHAQFGRLGGEEFAVLLHDASAAEAFEVAETMRRCVHDLAFVAAPRLKVTASFGVAFPQRHGSVEQWMGAADAALYCAKHAGRNRTIIDHTRDDASRAA